MMAIMSLFYVATSGAVIGAVVFSAGHGSAPRSLGTVYIVMSLPWIAVIPQSSLAPVIITSVISTVQWAFIGFLSGAGLGAIVFEDNSDEYTPR